MALHQFGNGKKPEADMLSWHFLDESIITLKVAGSCHHLLVSWSVQSIAWLRFFGGISRSTPELEYTVGSSAMLCHRMHGPFLPRHPCITSACHLGVPEGWRGLARGQETPGRTSREKACLCPFVCASQQAISA